MCIKSVLAHANFSPAGKNIILDVKAGKSSYNWSKTKPFFPNFNFNDTIIGSSQDKLCYQFLTYIEIIRPLFHIYSCNNFSVCVITSLMLSFVYFFHFLACQKRKQYCTNDNLFGSEQT